MTSRPSTPARSNDWRLDLITETLAFDILARSVFVLWFLFVGFRMIQELSSFFIEHGSVWDLQFVATALARVAVLLFVCILIALVVIRRRPVLKSRGPWPRLAAFFGTFIILTLPLAPANDLSPAALIAASALIFFGNGLSVYVAFGLGRSFSIMPEARKLMTDGPYAFVRHPLYLAEEVAVLGSFVVYASPWATAILILHGYLQFQRMLCEEKVLREAFPEYANYARHTARLIPGVY